MCVAAGSRHCRSSRGGVHTPDTHWATVLLFLGPYPEYGRVTHGVNIIGSTNVVISYYFI